MNSTFMEEASSVSVFYRSEIKLYFFSCPSLKSSEVQAVWVFFNKRQGKRGWCYNISDSRTFLVLQASKLKFNNILQVHTSSTMTYFLTPHSLRLHLPTVQTYWIRIEKIQHLYKRKALYFTIHYIQKTRMFNGNATVNRFCKRWCV